MNRDVHFLADWKLFCAMCREEKSLFCSADTRKKLNRFYARYRLAANFESVHLRGYSDNAQRGYAAGLRLLAAYSAAELLGEALGVNVKFWNILDPSLAKALRKNLGRAHSGAEALFSQTELREKLQIFMNGDDNVRVAATALRVMVAHGSFTPTGVESLTKRGANALQKLSNALLQNCEWRFHGWLGQLQDVPEVEFKPASVEQV
jgi:hypothetical protein